MNAVASEITTIASKAYKPTFLHRLFTGVCPPSYQNAELFIYSTVLTNLNVLSESRERGMGNGGWENRVLGIGEMRKVGEKLLGKWGIVNRRRICAFCFLPFAFHFSPFPILFYPFPITYYLLPIPYPMSSRGEVLVVIMNNWADWAIACEQGWYRIPVEQVEKLKQRQQWLPPKWLAFYQTKEFETEAFSIRYYAGVKAIWEVQRWELFPQEARNSKSHKSYCKLEIESLQSLVHPIKSDRLRRLTFIATTWDKLMNSQEIKDL